MESNHVTIIRACMAVVISTPHVIPFKFPGIVEGCIRFYGTLIGDKTLDWVMKISIRPLRGLDAPQAANTAVNTVPPGMSRVYRIYCCICTAELPSSMSKFRQFFNHEEPRQRGWGAFYWVNHHFQGRKPKLPAKQCESYHILGKVCTVGTHMVRTFSCTGSEQFHS